jgi:hypothetical protein
MPVTRLPEETLARVRQMAREDGDTMQGILIKAVEAYRRARMIERLNADFHRLQADPAAWAEEVAERHALEGTLADDLDDEPPHA